MANITLTIPDAQLPRVIAALCARGVGTPAVPVEATGPNAKQVVIDWIKETVKAHETRLAQEALAAIDTANLIT